MQLLNDASKVKGTVLKLMKYRESIPVIISFGNRKFCTSRIVSSFEMIFLRAYDSCYGFAQKVYLRVSFPPKKSIENFTKNTSTRNNPFLIKFTYCDWQWCYFSWLGCYFLDLLCCNPANYLQCVFNRVIKKNVQYPTIYAFLK